jgi:hypothetical protein
LPATTVRGTVIVSVDVAVDPGVRETLAGLTDTEGPAGETVADNDTSPEKPVLETLIEGVAEEPTLILWGGAGTATLKALPTLTVTVAVWDIAPLVAVTVMV